MDERYISGVVDDTFLLFIFVVSGATNLYRGNF